MTISKPPAGAPVKKRKAGPWLNDNRPDAPLTNKRAKRNQDIRDARTLATQTSSSAFKDGELNLDKFVKAREYEIGALEHGLQNSKKASNTRAFQQVPKHLRRRTASHNAKRVPKRLQQRAKKEMAIDDASLVKTKSKKPSGHTRLRLDNAKKLRALGAKGRGKTTLPHVKVKARCTSKTHQPDDQPRPNELRKPPLPKRKFRKRQVHKSWLPTHMFHSKRARMTPPQDPLWRFSIPLTPSLKSYRPTHRAASERGAIAWDTSYMSTIQLTGLRSSILAVLAALGLNPGSSAPGLQRWCRGGRSWHGQLRESTADLRRSRIIGPATVIWRPVASPSDSDSARRTVFVRTHPSAFHSLWNELVRLGSLQSPRVTAEDLRFEIGSIEVTGPGACEALQSALWPYRMAQPGVDDDNDAATKLWRSLQAVRNPAVLPPDIILPLDIIDPRLRFPPRPLDIPGDEQPLLTSWPLDTDPQPARVFDAKARRVAARSLPSQRTINRRKAASPPGQYPPPTPADPPIPCLVLVQRHPTSTTKRASWTVLLPWKCVSAVWYSLTYYPLSTGGQVRFGGLREQRQLSFEAGAPWFPADYPGTQAGDEWEWKESARRKTEWERRPKGKRTNFDTLKLDHTGRAGEIGDGWACDWKMLVPAGDSSAAVAVSTADAQSLPRGAEQPLRHLPRSLALPILRNPAGPVDIDPSRSLITVRVTLLGRGVPDPCARIYRLPDSPPDRDRWLSLLVGGNRSGPSMDVPAFRVENKDVSDRRVLARELLAPPRSKDSDPDPLHPPVPDRESLIGFITTGEFNLVEGKGIGIGSLLLGKVTKPVRGQVTPGANANTDVEMEDVDRGSKADGQGSKPDGQRSKADGQGSKLDGRGSKPDPRDRDRAESRSASLEPFLCIVRNAGEHVGRLARWEVV